MSLLIPVDQEYLESLISVLQLGHAELMLKLKNNRKFGLNKNCHNYIHCMTEISNIIFYLTFFDVDNDDCYYVNFLKEQAMSCVNFSESDITNGAITRTITSEGGIVFLNEESNGTIDQE